MSKFGRVWKFDEYQFSTEFDSSNLHRVELTDKASVRKKSLPTFSLWIRRDCEGTEHQTELRSWFFFSVVPKTAGGGITIRIKNINPQQMMFKHGYKPVFCVGDPSPHAGNWGKISDAPKMDITRFATQNKCADAAAATTTTTKKTKLIKSAEDFMSLTWNYHFDDALHCPNGKTDTPLPVYFAFCYPYSFVDIGKHVKRMESNVQSINKQPKLLPSEKIYWHRTTLVRSLNGRPMELLTVTSQEGMSPSRRERVWDHPTFQNAKEGILFPEGRSSMAHACTGKEVVILSSRVHPGETPASFIFDGFLEFILSNDPRAILLRKYFVFKLIPALNPDGVAEGCYRSDSLGRNLNRFYLEPQIDREPTIFASKALCHFYSDQGKLKLFLDLHAHANKKGMFCFGNTMNTIDDQITTELYPNLIALNCPHLDVDGCDFSTRNIQSKSIHDASTGVHSKSGAGRAAMYSSFRLMHSYTLESHYHMDRTVHRTNKVAAINSPGRNLKKKTMGYSPAHWRCVGKASAVALLDLRDSNPFSRLPGSFFRNLRGMRKYLQKVITDRQAKAAKRKSKTRKEPAESTDASVAAAAAATGPAKGNVDPKAKDRKSSKRKKSTNSSMPSSPKSIYREKPATSHGYRVGVSLSKSRPDKKPQKSFSRPRSQRGRKIPAKVNITLTTDHGPAPSRVSKASVLHGTTASRRSHALAEAMPPPSPKLSSSEKLKIAVHQCREEASASSAPAGRPRRLSSPARLKRTVQQSRGKRKDTSSADRKVHTYLEVRPSVLKRNVKRSNSEL